MNKNLIIGIVVVALLALGGYYFYAQQGAYQTPAPATTQELPMIVEEETPPAEVGQEAEVREITVEGQEFSFSPGSITVTEGERIRLTFTNVGSFPHNFIVDELGIATQTIPPGGSDTIEFTSNQSGTFSFYCSVGNHRELGMEGTLDIE